MSKNKPRNKPNGDATRRPVRVWDLPVRLLHWSLVASIGAAWLSRDQIGPLHQACGYVAAAIVALRLAWGVLGGGHARFGDFVRGAGAVTGYLGLVIAGRAPRYLGHNPLGGWMVLALLSCIGLLAASGWLLDTELLWGYAWPVRVHAGLGWLLLGLIALHLAGVVFTSWQHRDNLVAAMFSGDKHEQ